MKVCKFPCFDLVDEEEGVVECLLEDNTGTCHHLTEGGSWGTCKSGGKSSKLEEYHKFNKVPTDEGSYLIWKGVPHESDCLGMLVRTDTGIYWMAHLTVSRLEKWEEGWTWERIIANEGAKK